MKIKSFTKAFLIVNLLAYLGITQNKPVFSQYYQENTATNPYSTYNQNIIPVQQYTQTALEYYQRGINYYNSNEYTKAIIEFEQALKLSPKESSTRINLAASLISRGSYFYKIDPAKAANDYRKAIYYLKYDDNLPDKQIAQENLNNATANLNKVLTEQKVNLAPKSRLKIAKELRGQGNFKEAVVEFQEALADKSLKLEVYETLGDIMRVLQKESKAVEYYQNAIAINSNDANLHFKLAVALTKIGNTDDAIKEYNIALNLKEKDPEILTALENIWVAKLQENPQDAVAHMNLGVVLQKKGNFVGAEAEYKMASELDPNNITLRLNQGTLFQAKGDIQMALRAYDSILQVNPTDSLTHFYRATALKQMGNIQGAIDEFQIVLKIDPNNKAAQKAMFEAAKESNNPVEALIILENLAKTFENDALAQYNLAYELHSQKRTDEALAGYQKAISLDPKLVDAYLNTASIYNERKMYPEAIATLQNGLVLNTNNQKLKDFLDQYQENATISGYESAIKKHNAGDYEGAIQDYLKIIAHGQASADIYVSLGAAYQAANKLNNAISSYNKALELDKLNSSAHYYLGTIYYSQKNYEKALSSYQKALSQDPQNGDIQEAIKAVKIAMNEGILEKGLEEYNAKRYQKALEIFNDAIKLDPNNGYSYYYRGLVYDAQKKYLQAIEDYKKALAKSEDLTVAWYSLALDYDTLNLKAEAKKAYQKFVSISKDQNDEYVKYAKQRLQKL